MNDQIKQIAERLAGLRDALDIGAREMAASCGISEEQYLAYESGEKDIPVSTLHQISVKYGIDLSALMFGDEPRMNAYFLTRAGKGAAVERTKAYKYQSLAAGFMNRKADPFIVTVEPNADSVPVHLNTHPGQEFNLVIEGRVLLQIGDKTLELGPGDSIYFDANRPHGMKALDGKTVKFLAVII
ncbi:helix-turn-helix domain-containing protein [Coprobacter tertius]|uniref:XRE family transcriptional regulator n=1 Tax=Coprobacter tertius TaxID=2944915 RepID=A0ABT1MI96_9BACT|nr:XRE family transcriptional regulator [Coprobacter tertius]MCP9612357.1 XRE family transcriptional regulator [Coprobacter tertius]